MRVYLPSTIPALADLLAKGEAGPPPLQAFAVAPALREAYASGDDEELEYVAMLAAARQSLRLLAADPDAPRRRVVLAADVPDGDVSWIAYDDEPATVAVGSIIPLAAVACGHIDAPDAAGDVAAAAEAIGAADAGDEDAEFTADSAEGHELAWYARQELRDFAGDSWE
jgi:hypothetical protein